MRFISNTQKKSNHLSEVCRLLKIADRAWLFVAYLRNTGLASFEAPLRRAAKRATIEIFSDIDRYFSEPVALQRVFKVLKGTPGKLYLVENSEVAFHPKLYCFFEGTSVHILVGSANATGGGLENNIEASLACTLPTTHNVVREIAAFRKSILDSKGTVEADIWILKQYETRYGVTEAERRRAQKKASAEISKLQFLDKDQMKESLREDQGDLENNRAFSVQAANYREARRVIEHLCESRINSRGAFLSLYERLVGARGKGQLWQSGGLHRSKNDVASHYRDVIRLIRQLRANISREKGVVFGLGLRLSRPIKGLGVNILTEIMSTLAPTRFAVLNKNPLTTLEYFGHPRFREQNRFTSADYESFNEIQQFVRQLCDFATVGQVDHFLNFIYWQKANAWKQVSSQRAK